MTTEQILQHIREVCGLVKPEYDEDIYEGSGGNYDDAYSMGTDYGESLEKSNPHLEHLLYTIGKHDDEPHPIHIDWEWGSRNRDKIQITIAKGHPIINKEALYDLTRTVEQNLTDNTELRELIISLIK